VHLFGIDIFCNIINVFTVTFGQFKGSLLADDSFLSEKKILLIINPLNSSVYSRSHSEAVQYILMTIFSHLSLKNHIQIDFSGI